MAQSPEWKEYLKKDLLEYGFLTGDALVRFGEDFSKQMRGILKEAGLDIVR